MIEFSPKEVKFLQSLEEARFATCHDNIPHVKPVSYIFNDGFIYIATDYETRTFQNLKNNSKSSLVIDIYKSGGHKAVCLQGHTEIIENGEVFHFIYQKFYDKFKWVRDDPWKENEAPFLKIIPTNKTSWGLT